MTRAWRRCRRCRRPFRRRCRRQRRRQKGAEPMRGQICPNGVLTPVLAKEARLLGRRKNAERQRETSLRQRLRETRMKGMKKTEGGEGEWGKGGRGRLGTFRTGIES